MLIQYILILATVLLVIFFLRHHGTTRAGALVKLGFALFLAFGVVAVIAPTAVSRLASLVGVGRGTDLVLYALVVAFGFATINTYLRFKELELRYARLARAVALRSAESPEPDDAEHDGTLH
jgi:small membrane protein